MQVIVQRASPRQRGQLSKASQCKQNANSPNKTPCTARYMAFCLFKLCILLCHPGRVSLPLYRYQRDRVPPGRGMTAGGNFGYYIDTKAS